MKTTIYCYSGTGNSLAISKAIAAGLGDAEVAPLARFRQAAARPATERVGIVFPIIGWGPPRSVDEFVSNLDLTGVRYTFAVADCGGTAAGALPRLRRALRRKGSDLAAGFIVRAPSYMASSASRAQARMIELVRKLSGKPFGKFDERLAEIVEAIRGERRMRVERNALPGAVLGNFMHDKAAPMFAKMSDYYAAGPTCAGCGTCARVCPRGNVGRENGKTVWRGDCDMCGACAAWCPRNAIGYAGQPAAPRGRNPQVTVKEMYVR